MGAIAITKRGQPGPYVVSKTTLTAADTLAYTQGAAQLLELSNPTAGSLTATLTGNQATTISPPGYGGTVPVNGGKAVVVAAGAVVAVELDSISAFLAGTTVNVTGGAGLTATLYSN